MGGRDYISAYNQNFRRNFSVVDVTNYSFAVHTYQVNDDGVSVSLVDTYTLVRGGSLNAARAADPRGLRQKTCPEQGIDTDVINVGIVPSVARRAETALTAEALGLPSTIEIETHFSNNMRNEDVFGILGARGLRDELNSYDFRVRPMNVAVNWDLSSIPADAATREGRTFTVTGTLDLSRIITTAQTYPLPAPVAADATLTNQAPPHAAGIEGVTGEVVPCPLRGRHVNFQGSPEHMMSWRHGGITNRNNVTATAQITFGDNSVDGSAFRISEFGASTFHYSARTNANFNDGAFNRDVFEGWATVRSGVGFGYFADRYDDIPLLIGETLQTQRLPGLQFRGAMGVSALANMGTIQYSPIGYDENPTFHYFSRVFYLPQNFDPANIGYVFGTHRIDDSLILFINGVEVYRYNTSDVDANVRISEPINWGEFGGHDTRVRNRSFHINSDFSSRNAGMRQTNPAESVFDAGSRTNLLSALQLGENILTAVVGDSAADSMATWFDLDLTILYGTDYALSSVEDMLPIRVVAESLGANVGWEQATQTVTITRNNETVSFRVGAAVSGGTATLVENRTFVPLRFVSEMLERLSISR